MAASATITRSTAPKAPWTQQLGLVVLGFLCGIAILGIAFSASMFGGQDQEELEEIVIKRVELALESRDADRIRHQVHDVVKDSVREMADALSNSLQGRVEALLAETFKSYNLSVEKGNVPDVRKALSSAVDLAPPRNPEVRFLGDFAGGKCLDGNPTWTEARMWRCQGEDSNYQKFVLTAANQLRFAGTCIDGTNVKEGQAIKTSSCDPSSEGQKWDYDRASFGPVKGGAALRNRQTGLCMVVGKGSTTPPVIAKECDGTCSQVWDVTVDKREDKQVQQVVEQYDTAVRQRPPRIMCWIMTHPGNHATKAAAVYQTWGRRCNNIVFMSSGTDPYLPVVTLDLGGADDSRSMLRPKSKMGWMHVYKNFLNDYDFFLKGDDDSYVVMDNLKAYLTNYNPDEAVHFGRLFYYQGHEPRYFSGGATIILSREALKRLGQATETNNPPNLWPKPDIGQAEDMRLSQVLAKLGVEFGDTHSSVDGRHTFLPLGINSERSLAEPADRSSSKLWIWKYSKDAKGKENCCSKMWISSHYTKPFFMFALDVLEKSQCKNDGSLWPYLALPFDHHDELPINGTGIDGNKQPLDKSKPTK